MRKICITQAFLYKDYRKILAAPIFSAKRNAFIVLLYGAFVNFFNKSMLQKHFACKKGRALMRGAALITLYDSIKPWQL